MNTLLILYICLCQNVYCICNAAQNMSLSWTYGHERNITIGLAEGLVNELCSWVEER